MILGCDAAGLDEDGNEVVVHAVDQRPRLDRRRDPRPASGRCSPSGTRAPSPTRSSCPRRNVVPKPASLSLRGGRLPADRLADGVPHALHPGRPQGRRLGAGAGRRRRRGHRADRAGPGRRAAGAGRPAATRPSGPGRWRSAPTRCSSPAPGCRCKVDAVMETVGRATWSHSIRSLRPGGAIVISGTTSGPKLDDAELTRIFFLQLRVIGSTMGTRGELAALTQLLDATGARPLIDRTLPMERGRRRASPRWPRATSSARSSSPADALTPSTCITGAGSGIGAAVARALHERGDELCAAGAQRRSGPPSSRAAYAGAAHRGRRPGRPGRRSSGARPRLPRRGSTRCCTSPGSSSWSRSPTSTRPRCARSST